MTWRWRHELVQETLNDELLSEIENAVNILKKLLCNGPVFMHCHAAVERSPLISIAFLLKEKKLNLTQAYEYVKQQNRKTNILLDQLKEI